MYFMIEYWEETKQLIGMISITLIDFLISGTKLVILALRQEAGKTINHWNQILEAKHTQAYSK